MVAVAAVVDGVVVWAEAAARVVPQPELADFSKIRSGRKPLIQG